MGIQAVAGLNSLWDVRPDVAKLLAHSDDGYKYTAHSNQKAIFVCPNCGVTYEKRITDVSRHGFSCGNCTDKISYPEKFMRSILSQLDLDYKYQVSRYTPGFDWIDGLRRYDFYVEVNNFKIFIEMDGGIGHGNRKFGASGVDVAGLAIDLEKDRVAQENGIDVIRVDCYYGHEDRFRYIKDHILKSRLNTLLNLEKVDWQQCELDARDNLVARTVALYTSGKMVKDIVQELGYCDKTIRRWLKQASNAGLCDFGTHEARRRSNRSKVTSGTPVNQYTKDNIYIRTYESMADAENDTGTAKSNIVHACNGKIKSAGGYKWFRCFDVNQPDKTKIFSRTEVLSA